ncbi:ATP-binding protein [Dactylosporangium sp. NPDC051541]|uniref:ATP-binding protein n=1 Tax=Dactylosporangium sp. NPDC051541 TaxID=3363977 RepID=UPI00379DAEBD
MLHGREHECGLIDSLLDDARAGRSGVLVVRGEAGIGKSALLEFAVARAAGMRVLRARGVEAEAEFPYAAVHQLLRPVRDRTDVLPARQAAAVRGAFGLGDVVEGDRFLLSVAVLSLLAEAAEERATLCVVDDAQWLDGSSADALAFVARRLEAEGVALLCAMRDGPGSPFAGLPSVRLGGLTSEAARSLLAGSAPVVADQLVAGTGGNPLALRELLGALTPGQRAGIEPLPARLPVGAGVEQLFLDRVRHRPPATRTLLLLAAAEERGDVGPVLRAAELLGVPAEALDDAERAGLVRIEDASIVFDHPLVRSAVYRGATFVQRREAEQALAAALVGDADRRVWHLAAAATAPDEAVAEELDRAADRAARRGGHATAARARHRAAALSGEPRARVRRLLAAAESDWLAGQVDRARTALDEAAARCDEPGERARCAWLRGTIEGVCGRPDTAYAILATAAEPIEPTDPAGAARLLAEAGRLAWVSGDLPRVAAAGRRLARLPERGSAVTAATQLVLGMGALLDGDTAGAAGPLREGRRLAESTAEPASLAFAAGAALFLGEDATALDLFTVAVVQARSAGAVSTLPMLLAPLASLHMWTGRFDAARSSASEGLRLALDTGQDNPAAHHRAVLAWVAAVQGRADDCRDAAEAALAHAVPQRLGPPAAIANWALALRDIGLGRPDAAYDRLVAPADMGHPLVAVFAAADLVEVAVRNGQHGSAATALETLRRWTGPAGAAWARALVERCRGLVDGTDAGFVRALALHAGAGRPFDAARTALLLGESLRRRRRRVEARGHLRSALETFERLGATPWAHLARVELEATGETVRKREPGAAARLTPQESQIVRLVTEGGTNREIAGQLFLSPRTVEYHLHKVFGKIGVASRTELVRWSQAQ